MQLHASILISLAAAALTVPAIAANAAPEEGADNKLRVTEFRGRPPFARHVIQQSADLARFEETAAAPAVRETRFRGRPPFSRHARSSDTEADLARFEETTQDAAKPRRRGPPGKMTSRR